ncbi:MAG: LysR family transcriptional regulator, partial [Lachnospiraceae bacterium]
MDINFEYYKIFYFVAKYQNITKAAAALGSNQPNVTRIMKLLESQLNCKLFIRGARGISLTEEGERLYSHVAVGFRNIVDAH